MIARIARYTEILIITGDLQSENARCAGAAHTKDIGNKAKKREGKCDIAWTVRPQKFKQQHKSYLRCAGSAAQSDLSDEPIINNEILLLFFSPLNVTLQIVKQ